MSKFDRKIKRNRLKYFKSFILNQEKKIKESINNVNKKVNKNTNKNVDKLKDYTLFMCNKYLNNELNDKELEEFKQFINKPEFINLDFNDLQDDDKLKIQNVLKEFNKKIDIKFVCSKCGKEYKRYSSYRKHIEKCK